MKYQITTILAILSFSTPIIAQNSPYIIAVDEYVPAPGQYINMLPEYEDGDDAAAMVAKCTEAIANNANHLISLGAWGGYITFHFDHPIVNVSGQKDFYIAGNAIDGCSEAGIVMVSRDDNHNGLPDDEWYDLSGSADDGIDEVIYDYELTYYYDDALHDISWTDNYSNTGIVHRNSFHQQEYFPCWLIEEQQLTFSGIRLPDNARDSSDMGSFWVLDAFSYGYADNIPNSNRDANSFDIGRAVTRYTRRPIYLDYIDFVRVYTGLNQEAGWLGETSTEIAGAEDLHPDAELAIQNIITDTPHKIHFDIMGRQIRQNCFNQIHIIN